MKVDKPTKKEICEIVGKVNLRAIIVRKLE